MRDLKSSIRRSFLDPEQPDSVSVHGEQVWQFWCGDRLIVQKKVSGGHKKSPDPFYVLVALWSRVPGRVFGVCFEVAHVRDFVLRRP